MYTHKELLSIQERINSDEKNLQKKKQFVNQAFAAFNAQTQIRDLWQGTLFIEIPDTTEKIGNDGYEINLALLPVILLTKFCDLLIDFSKHCAESVDNDQPKLFDHG